MTKVSGVEFETAWHNRIQIQLEDIAFYVIGLSDLIVNKKSSGRPKDIADVAALEEIFRANN